MEKRKHALIGVMGPLIGYLFIGISITRSAGFSWQRSALSDLGHSTKSEVAQIFNFGLILAGFLILIYAVSALREHAKYTSLCLGASAWLLQLIATFDEVYGSLHYAVSVLFFTSIGLASIIYALEKRSPYAAIAFLIGIISWALYGAKIYRTGIAVPETVSSLAVASWIMYSAIKIYSNKTSFLKPNRSRLREQLY